MSIKYISLSSYVQALPPGNVRPEGTDSFQGQRLQLTQPVQRALIGGG